MDSLRHCARQRAGLLPLLVLSTACATAEANYRATPDLGTRLPSARTVGIAPPVMRIYEVGAGGTREPKEEWSAQARASVSQALVKAFTARGLAAKLIASGAEADEAMQGARLLYEAVGRAIVQATYTNRFPGPTASFDYSLGDIGGLLDRFGVDAMVFAYGTDDISSAGRAAATAVTIAALAVLGVSATPRGGVSWLSLALVERTGRVLWFDMLAVEGAFDLRDAASAEKFVAEIVAELPRASP